MDKKIAMNNLLDITRSIELLDKMYFITDGTLLGAVRGGDFIDFDEDVDIGVFGHQWSLHEFVELIKRLMMQGFILYHSFGKFGECFEAAWMRNGVKVDMFFYWKVEKLEPGFGKLTDENGSYQGNGITEISTVNKYIFHAFLNGGRTLPDDIIEFSYPAEELLHCSDDYPVIVDELKKVKLKDNEFFAPCQPTKFLETKYGHDWRTPNQRWSWANSPLNRVK